MDRHVVPTADDVFLDYGSGLGRVLMMAATYPFRRMIGVEFSESRATAARQIIEPIRHRLRCRDVCTVTADAVQYDLPPDVTVVYMYNPFGGAVMRTVCEKMRQSLRQHPRRLRVVTFCSTAFQASVPGCDWIAKRAEVHFPSIDWVPFVVYQSVSSGTG